MRRVLHFFVRSVLVFVLLVIGLLAVLLIANAWAVRDLPPVVYFGSNSQIEIVARKNAFSDIAAGQPHICLAGSFGPHPVGLSESEQDAVADLPGKILPWSCEITPGSFIDRVGIYAVAYNQEISRYFESNRRSSNQTLQPTADRSDH